MAHISFHVHLCILHVYLMYPLCMYMHPHPCPTHTPCSPTETGSHSNRWNLITYRLALAVYVRSPAAYEALKSFGVLQLPSRRSLQYFLGANTNAPGVNEKALSEQRNLYDAFCSQQKREGKKAPLYEGILIFDEVKVQNKVGII